MQRNAVVVQGCAGLLLLDGGIRGGEMGDPAHDIRLIFVAAGVRWCQRGSTIPVAE